MIDTHCHLTFAQLFRRLDDVLLAAEHDGVDRIISVGTTPDDAENARQIAEHRKGVWFSAGVHPLHVAEVDEADLQRIPDLVAHRRCVAFGEMGLDHHYDEPDRARQRRFFERQLAVVAETGLAKPVIIHCRKAVDDTLAILADSAVPAERCVFHCFTEQPEDARKVLDAGAMISFTGIVTYKNAPEVRDAAKLVPDDRIMVETDAPFLTPDPHRKIRPNEPRYVVATARFLADLRGTDADDFIAQCDANAERFFGLNAESGRVG